MSESVAKKSKFCQFLVERFLFLGQLYKNCDFPVSEGSTNDMKTRFVVGINLVIKLGEGKMYLAALHRIPTQRVGLSQTFERWILQKQQEIMNKISERWDKNTIKILEQVCPKQAHAFFAWLLSSKTLLPTFLINHLRCTLNFSLKNLEEKDWVVSNDSFSWIVTIYFTLQTLQH